MLALGLAMCTSAVKQRVCSFTKVHKWSAVQTVWQALRLPGSPCTFHLSADCVLISVMSDSGLHENTEFSCHLSI